MEHDLTDQLVVATDSQVVADVVGRGRASRRCSPIPRTCRAPIGSPRSRVGAEFASADDRRERAGRRAVRSARGAGGGASTGWREGDDVGTAAAPLDPALADDPARVKVVTDAPRPGALLLARRDPPPPRAAPTPADGLYWQHLGIYAYTRAALSALGSRRAAEPGGAGRAAGAAPGAALRSHHRRGAARTSPRCRASTHRMTFDGRRPTGTHFRGYSL